ncbi:MAG TPA: response regulator [Candidatus Acidoferrales bacterium]|jgi:twitching motility two-component system response regulator PilG|nr:response regulator [Candidatus Acidoferrales bacterium]
MSDTFEFSVPEANQFGNCSAGKNSSEMTGNPALAPDVASAAASATNRGTPATERRSRRRALISAPVRVRSMDVTDAGPDEISTTLDVSRGGVLFGTRNATFEVGMIVAVTFPYSKSPVAVQAEQSGRVARVAKLPDGRYSVAVVLRSGAGEDLVDSGGRMLDANPAAETSYSSELPAKNPLIIVVDKDSALREALKTYLTTEGYQVIALADATEAHHALEMFTPALLIAEIEGEDLPGYELCAYVKATPRLQTVPVMLMTSSAYPSDYANAHSLGAVVCIAKPYRQERLGHVVRLLAPTRQAREQAAPARPGDASRKIRSGNAKPISYTPNIRFRPSW